MIEDKYCSKSMKKGAVTFLDVIGWNEFWQRKKDAIEVIEGIAREALKTKDVLVENGFATDTTDSLKKFDNVKAEIENISDTIVIFTEGKPEVALMFHWFLCTYIIAESLQNLLPVRGATSYGYYKKKSNVLVGPAVDEAAAWYETADWIGVFHTPGALYTDVRSKLQDMVVEYDVPTKQIGNFKTNCVNWVAGWELSLDGRMDKKRNRKDLLNTFVKMSPITPDIATKYVNTLNYYDYVTKTMQARYNRSRYSNMKVPASSYLAY